jgi:hypothetical protein
MNRVYAGPASGADAIPTFRALVAADFPIMNQNTSGNAATATTATTATNVSGTVAVANGGTGATTLTGLVKGNGTGTMTAAVAGTDYLQAVAPSTLGNVLTSNGTTWTSAAAAGGGAGVDMTTDQTIGGAKTFTSTGRFRGTPNGCCEGTINLENGDPIIRFFDNDVSSSADKKKWDIRAVAAPGWEEFAIRTINDANNAFSTKLSIAHSGNITISSLGTGTVYSNSGTLTNANPSGALSVINGGTGAATLTLNNVLLGNGTNALQAVAPGTLGNVLTSNGTTWTSAAAAGGGIHTIGETYGGGKVFYVYDGGKHGLIAANADQGIVRWGANSNRTRAMGDGVGAGLNNTAIIIANQAPVDANAFAATLCNEYSVISGGVKYGGWYLPSKHELGLLFEQKSILTGLTGSWYYSSTETSAASIGGSATVFDRAWLLDGGGTSWYPNVKGETWSVRAIRAF